jgi:lipopolysaccharide/colanic/teichoic acid biosynthesis glycosyltransferase
MSEPVVTMEPHTARIARSVGRSRSAPFRARPTLGPSAARIGASADRRLRTAHRVALRLQLAAAGLRPLVRRGLDLGLAGLGLFLVTPVFLLIALAIKLDSRGPVFFGQERVGRNGRRFTMWKFRTMVVAADALKDQLQKQHAASGGVRFKMVHDPRVTRAGRVLRKLSLDELPQLFNVFLGDMTLVGPRPPIYREVSLYQSRALRRLEVTPGLTCLWQVRGRSNLSFAQQVELDLEYIDRTTATDELYIVLATVPAVITGRGAY